MCIKLCIYDMYTIQQIVKSVEFYILFDIKCDNKMLFLNK